MLCEGKIADLALITVEYDQFWTAKLLDLQSVDVPELQASKAGSCHGMTWPAWLSPKVKLHYKARLLSSKCQQTQTYWNVMSCGLAGLKILVAGHPLGGDSLSLTKGAASRVFPAAHLPYLDP